MTLSPRTLSLRTLSPRTLSPSRFPSAVFPQDDFNSWRGATIKSQDVAVMLSASRAKNSVNASCSTFLGRENAYL
ncbi:MAG: hypothetical protein LBT62_03180 [Deltaproteobacteria bacterium]|nr:hypothetical protein [Deltaproteobacteria bacterium]